MKRHFPPRTNYSRYGVWVARQFDPVVRYSSSVCRVSYEDSGDGPLVAVNLENGMVYYARGVSFALGALVNVPEPFVAPLGDPNGSCGTLICSSALATRKMFKESTVIGASQSAVEMLLDLPKHFPSAQITGICRSFGYKQRILAPFTERVYEPEFVDRFYNASEGVQNNVRKELWRSNYGAADHDVIAALQFLLYEQKVTGRTQIRLMDNLNNIRSCTLSLIQRASHSLCATGWTTARPSKIAMRSFLQLGFSTIRLIGKGLVGRCCRMSPVTASSHAVMARWLRTGIISF